MNRSYLIPLLLVLTKAWFSSSAVMSWNSLRELHVLLVLPLPRLKYCTSVYQFFCCWSVIFWRHLCNQYRYRMRDVLNYPLFGGHDSLSNLSMKYFPSRWRQLRSWQSQLRLEYVFFLRTWSIIVPKTSTFLARRRLRFQFCTKVDCSRHGWLDHVLI